MNEEPAPEILSVSYPGIRPYLEQFEAGIFPFKFPTCVPVMVIKASKECLLTAQVNQGIKVYIVPDFKNPSRVCGLITAFFDDHDC